MDKKLSLLTSGVINRITDSLFLVLFFQSSHQCNYWRWRKFLV